MHVQSTTGGGMILAITESPMIIPYLAAGTLLYSGLS